MAVMELQIRNWNVILYSVASFSDSLSPPLPLHRAGEPGNDRLIVPSAQESLQGYFLR